MAGVFPNVLGTGDNIPVSNYTVGITESYPNVNRQKILESFINSKERIDVLPVNMGINYRLTDRYLEIRIPGTTGAFLNLSSFLLEMKLLITKTDGTALDADNKFGLVNGISNTLFKSISLFINDKMIESNPIFNYFSYLKMLMNINKDNVDSFGKCGYFHDDTNSESVTKSYTDAVFTGNSNIEHKLLASLRSGGGIVDICFPLLFDSCSLDMYLLDGVDV